MATLFYAKISSVNYQAGTANVTLQDREDQVIREVPFLSAFYEMPKPGETVAVIFEEDNGQIGKGVILGRVFLQNNAPAEYGADIFYKEFTDGKSMKYTPASGELELRTKKVVVDELIYKKLTQR